MPVIPLLVRIYITVPLISLGTFIGQRCYRKYKYLILLIALFGGELLTTTTYVCPAFTIESMICILASFTSCAVSGYVINNDNKQTLSVSLNMLFSIFAWIIAFVGGKIRGTSYMSISRGMLYVPLEIIIGEILFIANGFLLQLYMHK